METILGFVEAEIKAGIPPSRIVLAGFSQGGALSLYTGLQYPSTLAGILVKSGYLPLQDSLKLSDAAKDTPIQFLHGDEDPMVLPAWAKASFEHVKDSFGIKRVGARWMIHMVSLSPPLHSHTHAHTPFRSLSLSGTLSLPWQ